MTKARIEFRLDLETSSSQPFRRKPSLLRWNDGIILTVHQQYLGEVFSFRLGRDREPAGSGYNGAHRPTPGRDSVERHDGALRKAEERDAVDLPANRCFSISLETTRSNGARACWTLSERLAWVTPATLNH